MAGTLTIEAPDGVPEVGPGDDLAALLLAATDLRDGDIVVVTSKVVSKAEGREAAGERDDLLPGETARLVARRGRTRIVRNHQGLTMAAAGIDASNVAAGRVLLLPRDPDASARRLRAAVRDRAAVNVGVLLSDTAGRAWREGQTDIAIGAAGLRVTEDFAGRHDHHGNELAVTQPAVADELTGAAELASGKLGGRPFVVVRGRADLVLDPADDGPGAAALARPEGADLFGYGAREAVLRALRADPADQAPFGSPLPWEEVRDDLASVGVTGLQADEHGAVATIADAASYARLRAAAFAAGWETVPSATPGAAPGAAPGADGPELPVRVRIRPRVP